jgi:hypothetical protein
MNLRIRLMVSSILFLLLSVLNPYVVSCTENEATLTLNEAEETLALTFEAVKEAETNGADISGLSELLNDATELLAQAHNSFNVGDYDKAENFANLVLQFGNDLKRMALSLEEIKSDLPAKELWDTFIVSVIGVIIVVILTFLSWTIFKKFYYKRTSIMKPQVAFFGY